MGCSEVNLFWTIHLSEADFPAVFFHVCNFWNLSWNTTDKYNYKIMKIRVSWVEQSTREYQTTLWYIDPSLRSKDLDINNQTYFIMCPNSSPYKCEWINWILMIYRGWGALTIPKKLILIPPFQLNNRQPCHANFTIKLFAGILRWQQRQIKI